MEIPNDAYATLSQNMIGCSTLREEKSTANWLAIIGKPGDSNFVH